VQKRARAATTAGAKYTAGLAAFASKSDEEVLDGASAAALQRDCSNLQVLLGNVQPTSSETSALVQIAVGGCASAPIGALLSTFGSIDRVEFSLPAVVRNEDARLLPSVGAPKLNTLQGFLGDVRIVSRELRPSATGEGRFEE
jgi:hypothetical protein